MKFSTFYFSGTGNTRWAVETFNAIIGEKGHQAEMVSIDFWEKSTDERILEMVRDADGIGLANSIYGGGIPPIMSAFIDRLVSLLKPEKLDKKTFVINKQFVKKYGQAETR